MATIANPHDDTLRAVTHPSFLIEVYHLFFACTYANHPLDAVNLLYFFGSNDEKIIGQVYDLCFERALRPISKIPLDEFPTSLLSYLGSPEANQFPMVALGLHLLLDQVPRLTLSGTDQRYTLAHFGTLALRLALDLAELPRQLQPLRLECWRKQRLDFERAWLRPFIALSAFAHAERGEWHQLGQELNANECRQSAEQHYGRTDPLRELDESDSSDTTLFPKLVASAEDGADTLTPEEAMWRMCRYVRAHEPVIRVFGRYPYRNGILGRDSTPEERAWIKRTIAFGTADPETEKALRADIEADRWTPLKGGRPV